MEGRESAGILALDTTVFFEDGLLYTWSRLTGSSLYKKKLKFQEQQILLISL